MVLFLILIFQMAVAAEVQLPVVNVSGPVQEDSALPVVNDPGARDVAERLMVLPNMSFTSGANRPRFFQVRGIGETSQFEHSQVNAFGVFYEGIDLSEEASVLPLLGGESLSAMYGPQSLRWGGKALAGSLEARSCLDESCPTQEYVLSGGSFRTRGLNASAHANGERFSWLAGARLFQSDGFYRNTFLSRPTSKQDEADAVVGFSYRVGDVVVREHHVLAWHNNGYDAWSFTPSFETRSDRPGRDRHQVHGHSWQYTVGPRFEGLTSVTFARQLESYDEDWGNNPYWNSVASQDYDYDAAFERARMKVHQKLTWTSDDGARVGLHYYRYAEDQVIRSFKDGLPRRETTPDFLSEHWAIWTGKAYPVGLWTWDLGVRAENQNIRLTGVGDPRSKSLPAEFSADAVGSRKWDEEWSSEVRLQRGFRGGGYNTTTGVAPEKVLFQPEQIYLLQFASEHKTDSTSWMGRVFYQWQEHMQARSSFQSDPTDPNTFSYFTANLPGSQAFGFETRARARFGNHWMANVAAGVMKSEYRAYDLAGRSLSGRAMAQAPPWTYSARLTYAPETFSVFAQLSGRDGYYHSVDHDYKSKPYHLTDVGATYRAGAWELRASVRNLFDQRYPVRVFRFANEPPAWDVKDYIQLGDPRTWMIQLAWEP